jgi:NodT family efflux transporter outer membrane factor (OMF) lipoprotein
MKKLSVCLVGSLLCAGCLSQPPSQEQIVQDALPATTAIPSAWQADSLAVQAGQLTTSAPTGGWLQQTGDAQLEQIVAEALANNLDLRKAAAQTAIAGQHVVLAGAPLLPQVGLQASKTGTKDFGQSEVYRSSNVVFGASWEIDLWGRLRAEQAAAEAGYQASALDFSYARQSLAGTAAKSWYQVVERYQLLQLAIRSNNIFTELLRLVEVRNKAGKVSDFDLSQSRASAASAQSALQLAQQDYAQSRRNLELLLGRYPAGSIQTGTLMAELPTVVAADTPVSILAMRPDVIAAEQRVISAFRLNEADRLALLPSFSLGLNAGRYSDGVLDLLNLEPWLGSAFIGMQVPIYEGGALRANIRISDEEQQQAIADYGKVVLNAFNEVESGLADEYYLEQSTRSMQIAEQQEEAAVKAVLVRYNVGASDMFTVLNVQLKQIEFAKSFIQQRYTQVSNWIDLNLALARSFDGQPMLSEGLAQ